MARCQCADRSSILLTYTTTLAGVSVASTQARVCTGLVILEAEKKFGNQKGRLKPAP